MKTIAVLSLKGGVGKTTLAVNLGAALSKAGNRVLLVDLDPQNDLTQNIGFNPAITKGVEYFLTKDLPFDAVVKNYNNEFDFLPAGKKLKELEISLSKFYKKNKEFCFLLKDALKEHDFGYDFVIIDCPPYAGLLNYNALAYAEQVLIPIQCQYAGIRGSQRTIYFFHKIRAFYNPELKIVAFIPVMHDARNKLSDVIINNLKKAHNGLVTETIIRVNVSLAEAPGFGKTIFNYSPQSRGAKDFLKLADELLEKYF